MKKLVILSLLFIGLSSVATAQKYFVYDGEIFSVMFKCNNDNTKVLDVQFSAQDDAGKWEWYKFDVYDYMDFENTAVPGFIFFVKDGVGNKYAVDYFRDDNYVVVHAIKTDGSYGTEWECKLRKE